jgi:hypothetical protein
MEQGTSPHRRRKRGMYALNEAYFDEILTAEQAYWLGFIAAAMRDAWATGRHPRARR